MRQIGFQEDDIRPRMVETGVVNPERRRPIFEGEEKKYKEVKFKKFV